MVLDRDSVPVAQATVCLNQRTSLMTPALATRLETSSPLPHQARARACAGNVYGRSAGGIEAGVAWHAVTPMPACDRRAAVSACRTGLACHRARPVMHVAARAMHMRPQATIPIRQCTPLHWPSPSRTPGGCHAPAARPDVMMTVNARRYARI
jgi:hypothetical protein